MHIVMVATDGSEGGDRAVDRAAALAKAGADRLARLLLGSVSQKLVSLAPCAVVVVP